MKTLTFSGGVHPPYNKEQTKDKPVVKILPQGEAIFLMQQHTGAICQPIVREGDKVLTGQMIADAVAPISAPVHSSISGTVKSITHIPYTLGSTVPAIVVENDHKYEEIEPVHKTGDYKDLTRNEIIDLIHGAGIIGMGGAAFPTYIKLSPDNYEDIHSIILNGCECEPYITCDHRLMLQRAHEIVRGLEIILYLFPNAKGYIGIEDNKLDAIEIIKEAIDDLGLSDSVKVKVLDTKYPQGSEKQLISAILDREIPVGKLPAQVGCIVQNVGTAYAVYEAIIEGRPPISRVITVTGDAIANPQNFLARIGTPFHELIDAAGGFIKEPAKIISGGPMMGVTMPNTNVPITKATTAILCPTKEQTCIPDESHCISCGRCIRACPMRLLPLYLDKYGRRKDTDMFEKLHGFNCIECGCCSYVCPAHLRIVNTIRNTKAIIRNNNNRGVIND